MIRIPDAAEADMQDLAFALLDRCRVQVGADAATINSSATAEQLMSATISMAVQSIVMANSQTIAGPGESFASIDTGMADAIYRGLGAGVGNCIGAAGDTASLEGLMKAYMEGMMLTIEVRSRLSRAEFLKSKLGPKP